MPKPIGITADIHLDEHHAFSTDRHGFNSRLMDGHDAVVYMASKVREAGGDTLIVVGDWFHNRKRVTVNTIHVSDMCLRHCRDQLKVNIVALEGNHDLSMDGRASSLQGRLFSQVISKPGVVEIGGYRVGCIPWTDDPGVVREVVKQAGLHFIIGHVGIGGSKVGPSGFEVPGHIEASDLATKKDVPVFLGHYHKPQRIPGVNADYIGSPLQVDWGESGDRKRFGIVQDRSVAWHYLDQFPRFVKTDEAGIEKVRNQDFVVATVRSEKVKQKIKESPNVRVVVEHKTESKAPRMLMPESVAEQVDAYMTFTEPPIDPASARTVALELLGEAT